MIDDPYKVLGITQGATKEEIKKAYRTKAKEYHPDLHPNDSSATEKMNEINEAYDMLNHPEKYQNKTQQAYQRQGYSNHYTYQQNTGGTGANWQQGYKNDRSYNKGNAYGGFYDGFGGGQDYNGFGYYDFFGFGNAAGADIPMPKEEQGDSTAIKEAIRFIRSGNYVEANNILNQIVSEKRDGRWYYLSSIVYCGAGNPGKAIEQIQKALQREPGNVMYQSALQTYQKMGYGYNYGRSGQSYGGVGRRIMIFLAILFILQMLFMCRMPIMFM